MKVKFPESERQLPPAGKHFLYLSGFVMLGRVDGKFGPQFLTYFNFDYAKATRIDEDNNVKPIEIGRHFYGKKAVGFYEELLDEGQLSTAEKAEGIDVARILGGLYKINVTHDAAKSDPTKIYANVYKVIERVESDDPRIPAFNEKAEENEKIKMRRKAFAFHMYWNPATGEPYATRAELFDCPNWKSLPEWIQKKIKEEVAEFKAMPEGDISSANEPVETGTDEAGDDVPF